MSDLFGSWFYVPCRLLHEVLQVCTVGVLKCFYSTCEQSGWVWLSISTHFVIFSSICRITAAACCRCHQATITESLHWSVRVQISQAASNNSKLDATNQLCIFESGKFCTLLSPPQFHYTWVSFPLFKDKIINVVLARASLEINSLPGFFEHVLIGSAKALVPKGSSSW